MEYFGHIDILINNAGIFPQASIEDLTFEMWDKVMKTDLYAQYYMVKAVLPRACLNIHSRHLHAPLRGIFGPNSGYIARYAPFLWTKFSTKWNAQLTESNVQTRSSMKSSGWGEIVNLTSGSIISSTPCLSHYMAAKMGVIGFTRGLAADVGDYGITR